MIIDPVVKVVIFD